MTKRELGENYFKQGYNCAQAVALAFEKELNLDKVLIAKTISGFGGGFGRMRDVCGAISGMVFVLSNLEGSFDPTDNNSKMEIYQKVQTLMKEFKDKNGTYICRELLALPEENSDPTPEARTESYYKRRPCALLVGDACEILENYLNK
jgi:C_GCAxxG_C_C family probable redox protein